jgi:hypothetical protein
MHLFVEEERRGGMIGFRRNTLALVLCFVAVGSFVLPMNVASVLAKEGLKLTTEIEHKPIEYFVPEQRIRLDAEVTDDQGVNVVRCYFRAVEQADYVFVAMKPGSSLYRGILPAPSKDTPALEYLFLVVNGDNRVVKTQTFRVEGKDSDKIPAWQEVSPQGDIRVTTELAQAPTAPPGFADSIAVDVAESSARFGFVVPGIYTSTQVAAAGGATGTAAAATSAGMVSAKTGGISTLAYVGGAALIAGIALAAGGGGGGGGSKSSDPCVNNSKPTVSNLEAPTSILQGQKFKIAFDYDDPDGAEDVAELHVRMSDGTDVSFDAEGSGRFDQGTIWFFDRLGFQWVEVYATDSCGNQSDPLTRNVTVRQQTISISNTITIEQVYTPEYHDGLSGGSSGGYW